MFSKDLLLILGLIHFFFLSLYSICESNEKTTKSLIRKHISKNRTNYKHY